MAKSPQELLWIEEDLFKNIDYQRKHMFGGFGYYLGQKIILVTFENKGDFTHRSERYDFEIWNGCLFPIEKELHTKALKKFPFLIEHPVLKKWLYLPLNTENFDDLVGLVIKDALKPAGLFGVVVKPKKGNAPTKKKSKKEVVFKVSAQRMREPQMFSDEPLNTIELKKISDFKNLGTESEKQFAKAGIKTPQKFIQLGWKKAWTLLAQNNPKSSHTLYGYALIGALKNLGWLAISDSDKAEAKAFSKELSLKFRKMRKPLK
jgi:hypothetical protein